jgi:hypothetical protein
VERRLIAEGKVDREIGGKNRYNKLKLGSNVYSFKIIFNIIGVIIRRKSTLLWLISIFASIYLNRGASHLILSPTIEA